ncbi:MAG: SEC-C metal-binding domain-containing protein [Pseudomonadota bacterium]
MPNIGRNDACPCGSGKKFKKCHMGREDELGIEKMERLPESVARKIASLPDVAPGRCRDFLSRLDLEKLTGAKKKIRFIDLESYLRLGFDQREVNPDLDRISAGQMINPVKTVEADPDHIFVAVSPAVSDSTLIHQVAHVLDYLAGSNINPGLIRPLCLELDAPTELLEHPMEFGKWLDFLRNEFNVQLDAEDAIVAFLFEQKKLLPGGIIKTGDQAAIQACVRETLEFVRNHRAEIDRSIKDREGYLPDAGPKVEPK